MKVLIFASLVLSAMMSSVTASATETAVEVKNHSVRDLYKAQCEDVGGSVNGFCMCTEKLNVLALATTAVEIAVTTKKIDKNVFGIINPFMQSCDGKTIDKAVSFERLSHMHKISYSYLASNKELEEEIIALDEAGLLDPNTFSSYLTKGSFRDKVKAKINSMKAKQDKMLKLTSGQGLLAIGRQEVKANAIKMVQNLTDIDIAQAKQLSTAVKKAVTDCVENAGEKTIKSTLVGMGTKAVKSGARALGKGFIAAVISSAAFEGISYMIGYDITKFDPFEIAFGVSVVADATISGHITEKVSAIYTEQYASSFELGLMDKYASTFSGRVALTSMIVEARSNGDSYVHFLDY